MQYQEEQWKTMLKNLFGGGEIYTKGGGANSPCPPKYLCTWCPLITLSKANENSMFASCSVS